MNDERNLKGADRTDAQKAADKRQRQATGANRTPAQKAASARNKQFKGANRTPAQLAADARRKGEPASPAAKAAAERRSARASDAHCACAAEAGYKVTGTWVLASHSIEMECPVGHSFKIRPSHFRESIARHGSPCPVCPNWKFLRGEQDTLARLDERGWTAHSEYQGGHTPMEMECDQGHIVWMEPASVQQGQGCKTCYHERQVGTTSWTTLGGDPDWCLSECDVYLYWFTDNSHNPFWKIGLSGADSARLDHQLSSGAVLTFKFRTYRLMAFMLEQNTLMAFEDGRVIEPQWDEDYFNSAFERAAESRIASYEERFRTARFQLDKCFEDISTPPSFKLKQRTYELTSFAWLQFLTYWRIAELYGATIEHRRELLWAVLHGQSVGSAFGGDRLRMKRYNN